MGLYLGIFLVTLSGLMFEIGLTRIFSATIWYHYAFVAISVALLGWGLGGFALHLLRGRIAALARARGGPDAALRPLDPGRAVADRARAVPPRSPDLLLRGLAAAVPARRHGALDAVRRRARARRAALLRRPRRRLARGARGHVPAVVARRRERRARRCRSRRSPRPRRFSRRLRAPAALLAVLVLVALGVNERTGLFKIRSAPTKGLYRQMAATPGARIALTGWNAYSRIDAVTGFATPTWRGSTSTRTPGRTSWPGTATSRASRRSASGTARCRSRSRPSTRRRW